MPSSNDQAPEAKSTRKNNLQSTSQQPMQRHKVQPGETLASIATIHHITAAALKRDNGNLTMPRPGMVLVIKDVG